jgi:hypothetical protein
MGSVGGVRRRDENPRGLDGRRRPSPHEHRCPHELSGEQR